MKNLKFLKSYSFLVGSWTGFGEMLIKPVMNRMGILPIDLTIDGNGYVTGRIGEAQLKNTLINVFNFGIEIRAELDNYVKSNFQIDKDRILLLFALPEFGNNTISQCKTNFHLKSNFFFDPTTMVGGAELTKR